MSPEAITRLFAARFRAAAQWPYLASGLFALTPTVTDAVETMAVSKQWRLYANPEFVLAHSADEIAAVWNHELQHLLRDHSGRAQRLSIEDHEWWNVCADAEINDDILTEATLPDGAITPALMRWRPHRDAEEYWNRPRRKRKVRCSDEGSGVHGIPRSWERGGHGPGVSSTEAATIRRRVAEAVEQHLRTGGTVPHGFKRMAEAILGGSKSDWRQVLAHTLRSGLRTAPGAHDYTHSRPSRRQSASPDVILPSMIRPRPTIAVVIDTSGSVSTDQLGTVLGDLIAISATGCGWENLQLIACDAKAIRATGVRSTGAAAQRLFGGGGTDMREGITEAERLRPDVIITFTDGDTPWPDAPTTRATYIAALLEDPTGKVGAEHPPWMRVVRIPRPSHKQP